MSEAKHPVAGSGGRAPHVAIIPSAGMGHLTVSIRLAVALASHGCLVTFITPRPTVSDAESRRISDLHSSYPHIKPLDLHLLPFDPSTTSAVDPFLLQFERIRRSASLLGPLLQSITPPISALLTDVSLISDVIPITAVLNIPNYVVFISCALMLALLSVFPSARKAAGDGPVTAVDVPGVGTLSGSWIPPPLHDPRHLFTTQFVENGLALPQTKGILINTFPGLERETLAALNSGAVVPGFPPVIAAGPQEPIQLGQAARPTGEGSEWVSWLDSQPPRSVLYVAFGNRTALSREQIRELGVGLEKSGCRFLWVVKSKVVDRDDAGVDLEELLGEGYRERVGDRGVVVKNWVEQEEVLAHRSVGGFLSHGGWNSVAEAALHGVRLLNWPGGGDQRMNAAVAEKCGSGVWVKEWGWSGIGNATVLVRGEEIAVRLRELMEDAGLGESVARIRDEAVSAVGVGGSTYEALRLFASELAAKGAPEPAGPGPSSDHHNHTLVAGDE